MVTGMKVLAPWMFLVAVLCTGCAGSNGDEGPALVSGPEGFNTPFTGISGVRWTYDDGRYPCPDGLPGRFHVIAAGGEASGGPLVVVLHGGAFDYVDSGGSHYAGVDKLNREWSECKLRDFWGKAAPGCDDAEANGGAIVAALIESGAVSVLPSNCYGDVWHGTGHVDPDDGFARHGLSLARQSAEFVQSEFGTDPDRRYAWGTSAGGHGIAELVVAGEELARAIADSPADYLPGAESASPQEYPGLQEGYRRIFEGDGSSENAGRFSLFHAVSSRSYGRPLLYLFSCNDTTVPKEITEPAARAILEDRPDLSTSCVLHAKDPQNPTGPDLSGHVFSNGRIQVARVGAAWLLDGTPPPACETTFVPCP